MLARIGTWCFNNPWKALAGWIVGIVAVMGISGAVGPAFNDAFETPDSETAHGFAVLEEYFPGQAGGVNFGSVVFQAEQGVADPEVQRVMEEFFAEIETKGDAGDYSVLVSNHCNSVSSNIAVLTVNEPATFLSDLEDAAIRLDVNLRSGRAVCKASDTCNSAVVCSSRPKPMHAWANWKALFTISYRRLQQVRK